MAGIIPLTNPTSTRITVETNTLTGEMISRMSPASPCLFVLLPCNRLVDDVLDRLGVTCPLHREIGGHGGVRHDQAHVLAVVVSMTDLLHRPSHLERHAIDEQCATYGRPPREQYADKFVSDYADLVALAFVVPIQSAPFVYRLVTNARELWLGAIHIPVAIAVLAHQAKVAAVDYG